MEKKKSSIEWLEEQYYTSEGKLSRQDFEQAKQMHKEEVMYGYAVGHNDGRAYMHGSKPKFKNPEQYYNETFGGEQ